MTRPLLTPFSALHPFYQGKNLCNSLQWKVLGVVSTTHLSIHICSVKSLLQVRLRYLNSQYLSTYNKFRPSESPLRSSSIPSPNFYFGTQSVYESLTFLFFRSRFLWLFSSVTRPFPWFSLTLVPLFLHIKGPLWSIDTVYDVFQEHSSMISTPCFSVSGLQVRTSRPPLCCPVPPDPYRVRPRHGEERSVEPWSYPTSHHSATGTLLLNLLDRSLSDFNFGVSEVTRSLLPSERRLGLILHVQTSSSFVTSEIWKRRVKPSVTSTHW